jgi:hypothetical protein
VISLHISILIDTQIWFRRFPPLFLDRYLVLASIHMILSLGDSQNGFLSLILCKNIVVISLQMSIQIDTQIWFRKFSPLFLDRYLILAFIHMILSLGDSQSGFLSLILCKNIVVISLHISIQIDTQIWFFSFPRLFVGRYLMFHFIYIRLYVHAFLD